MLPLRKNVPYESVYDAHEVTNVPCELRVREVDFENPVNKMISPMKARLIMRYFDQANVHWKMSCGMCKRKVGEIFNRYLQDLRMSIILEVKVIVEWETDKVFTPPYNEQKGEI